MRAVYAQRMHMRSIKSIGCIVPSTQIHTHTLNTHKHAQVKASTIGLNMQDIEHRKVEKEMIRAQSK